MTVERTSPSPPLHRVEEDERPPGLAPRVILALIVGIPLLALVFGVTRFWGRGIHLRDVLLAAMFYVLLGHGMTIGFHRLLAHKSFTARRTLKFSVVTLGSTTLEGGPIGWVANHRGHHVFADTAGDPHAPEHHGGVRYRSLPTGGHGRANVVGGGAAHRSLPRLSSRRPATRRAP